MSDLHFENIVRGIASRECVREVGSQFGSIWGFDGLLTAEATPEEYAAYRGAPDIRLCHSEDINWLGRKWSVILAYRGQKLAQVSVYIPYDDQVAGATLTWLSSVLGEPKESGSEFSWVGLDGLVKLRWLV
jgi:hypothetical protein